MPEVSVREALELALTAHRENELGKARKIYEDVLKADPENVDSLHYLGLICHQEGKLEEGIEYMKKALKLAPDNTHYWQNIGSAYSQAEDYENAMDALKKSIELEPNNHIAYGNMVYALKKLERYPEAIEYGQQCLDIKDKFFCAAFNKLKSKPSLQLKKHPGAYAPQQKNVISFSLWGDNEFYTGGAIANAAIAPYLFPEWVCRFYCGKDVPQAVLEKLNKLGAEVMLVQQKNQGAFPGLAWRFLVSDDESVTRFICRDCDSRLSVQEKIAVDEWVASNKYFHILRDNIIHCELILAGMWGGIAGVIPNMQKLIEEFYTEDHAQFRDQGFLRTMIWPLIKDTAMTHDRYYRLGDTKGYSPYGERPGLLHIGGSEQWDLKRFS
ncbi:MAG: hypothetical protein CMF50_00040 [Legionellales bacterium]|nr:hypothetical protein [Legionellales bacterium]|tara:strand:+ start:12526 stop:13674 length:1149 start_codon:yes stop_codon:yes gene_type:complete